MPISGSNQRSLLKKAGGEDWDGEERRERGIGEREINVPTVA